MLISYVALILVTVRFAGSTVEFRFDFLPEGEIAQKFILILYAVFLVMYIELSSGVIRFSMLDTSIRMNEVYVMGCKQDNQEVPYITCNCSSYCGSSSSDDSVDKSHNSSNC